MPIDGGAVEASWVVRSDDGRAITDCTCSDPEIVSVRLDLTGTSPGVYGSTPCRDRQDCRFSCQRHTGATPFDIPPGFYLIAVTPVGAVGEDLTTNVRGTVVGTPPPVMREVVKGQPTQLDAWALVSGCASSCSVNKNRVCTRP